MFSNLLNLIKFQCFNAPFLTNIDQQKVKHYSQKTSSIMAKVTGMSQHSLSYADNKQGAAMQYTDRCSALSDRNMLIHCLPRCARVVSGLHHLSWVNSTEIKIPLSGRVIVQRRG